MPISRLLLALPFAFLLACNPKPGDKCSPGQAACLDPTTGLFCNGGKMTTMTCKGSQGCVKQGSSVLCDNSVASEKDGCNEKGDVACALDKKAALECKDSAFALAETCKGVGGCQIKQDKITCDNDIADPGDPCHFLNDYACTSDKQLVLRCDANKMTPLNSCRGPRSCRVIELPQEKKIEFFCDDSVAQENDPCDTNGEEACTMDKKGMLVCRDHKFVSPKPCPNGCLYDEKGDKYTCEQGGATASAGGVKGKKK
jgi:hypothetical protein